MWIQELRLECLRAFKQVEIEFSPGINFFMGCNGAGKTTILEAVYLLSHGRSFRTTRHEILTQYECPGFSVFAHINLADGATHRIGLQRKVEQWQARIDGVAPPSLSTLLQQCAVTCFEPGSHQLISGSSEERRRFLDWGLFHVEPEFLAVSRRFRRALKQRNALLKQHDIKLEDLDPWNFELAQTGEKLAQLRENYLLSFEHSFQTNVHYLLNELGKAVIKFDRGWSLDISLEDALNRQTTRDLIRGYTSVGPHRADWEISFAAAPRREHLSRGQEKLCALACMLGQVQVFYPLKEEYPIVCLDDLASELDLAHQTILINLLETTNAQILITGTELPDPLKSRTHSMKLFHVEQGQIQSLL